MRPRYRSCTSMLAELRDNNAIYSKRCVFTHGLTKAMVRSMLSESLMAVVSQTLLKRNGGGRVAALEILRGTAAIRNLIREDKIAQMYSAIQTGQSVGMQTMDQGLQQLVDKRLIDVAIARSKARQPDNIV